MREIRQGEWECLAGVAGDADVICGARHIARFRTASIAAKVVKGHNDAVVAHKKSMRKRRPDGDDVGDEV